MEEFIFRAVERILDVIIGGFAIHLGYRLFVELPKQTDSSGKITLPGGVNVFLSRIGPGIFFSLFGTVIVALSLYQRMEIDIRAPQDGDYQENVSLMRYPAPEENQSLSIRYLSDESQLASEEMLTAMRSEANRTVFELNRLPSILPADLLPAKRLDINQAIRESKLAIVHSVWGRDWGNYVQFKSWIDKGEPDQRPKGFDFASVKLFRNGQQEKAP
jgi:hypothetical protein